MFSFRVKLSTNKKLKIKFPIKTLMVFLQIKQSVELDGTWLVIHNISLKVWRPPQVTGSDDRRLSLHLPRHQLC